METFEIIVNDKSFKILRDTEHRDLFSVFTHTTYCTIRKGVFGSWEMVAHRVGPDQLPIDEIGDEIDRHYDYLAYGCIIKNLEQHS